jgi:hypothetical protein
MAHAECFFFIDLNVPEEERSVESLCMECHEEHLPDTGWYWNDDENGGMGFGPWKYHCKLCQKLIHDGEPNEEQDESKTSN